MNRRAFVKLAAGLAIAGRRSDLRGAIQPRPVNRDSPDIRRIKERFVACYLRTLDVAVPESPEELVARQRGDGGWADLDDSAPPIRGQVFFRPFPHVHRLRKLAGAHRRESNARQREQLGLALRRGLGWWLEQRPTAAAAWFQEIGVPTQLAQMALLAEDVFNPEEMGGVIGLLRTSLQEDGTLYYSGKPATAQNLIWEAHLQIVAGCLANEAETIARYARRAEQEMQVTLAEGVQPDYSFHQHGSQLYAGGYGQNFAEDCARLIRALDGTRFAFAPATVETLLRYLLDGQQWMIRGKSWDYGAIGRWVAWPEGVFVESDWRAVFPGAVGLALACRDLLETTDLRRDELLAFSARLDGEAAPDARTPLGCRVFWRSEYAACSRRDFFFGVRMSSRRVIGTETSGTGQGLLNWHLGDGATCLMRSGREYADIAPVWNWRRLPGVTCVYTPEIPLPRNVWGRGAEGGSDFAGGVTDGNTAIAAMELARGGARARKAWFLLGQCVVCLGTDIRAEANDRPLVTGVEQCWARSSVTTSVAKNPLQMGESVSMRGRSWVHHDEVAYFFGGGSEVRVRCEYRHAPWSIVNTFIHAPEYVEGDVFELWLEHPQSKSSADYHYVIAPGLGSAEIESFRRDCMPRILSNTPEVQALAVGGTSQAVFWQAGVIDTSEDYRLSVDAPCLVQLREHHGEWVAAVSDPARKARTLRITMEEWSARRRVRTAEFVLPTGADAGASQVQSLGDH